MRLSFSPVSSAGWPRVNEPPSIAIMLWASDRRRKSRVGRHWSVKAQDTGRVRRGVDDDAAVRRRHVRRGMARGTS